MINIEVWKDVVGYEGLYEVSSHGRVRSLDRIVTYKAGGTRKFYGKILSLVELKNKGYLVVPLSRDGKTNNHRVNRLVAIAFIENPDNKEQVNHIDENKKNNNVENLEWSTSIENVNHGTGIDRRAMKQRNNTNQSKPVRGIHTITGNIIEFPSISEASRNGFDGATISKCCKDKYTHYKTYKKYKWEFIKGDDK